MKRKLMALSLLLILTLTLLVGCGPDSNTSSTTLIQQTNIVTTPTTTATTKVVTLDDVAQQFVGFALDDVSRAFSEANKAHLFSYESDNGKTIIVKNNWAVSDYRISDHKIVFICTKFRNDGILEAAAENADGIAAAIEILNGLS